LELFLTELFTILALSKLSKRFGLILRSAYFSPKIQKDLWLEPNPQPPCTGIPVLGLFSSVESSLTLGTDHLTCKGGYEFFSKKNILIPNVAEKNILILVEGKKII
jgi:hypothetical protein